MIRLYFNAKEEWPLVWSVDEGDPSTERKAEKVMVYAIGETVFDRRGITQPRAWVQYENCHVSFTGNQAIIAYNPE